MEAYESFASIYDIFMNDVKYDKWIDYIQEIWKKNNCKPKLIAELGCGTGNITQRLAQKGYEMIGIDLSDNMLSEAKKKAEKENLDILYILQDMREFELYGTVDCILALCDSLNYITEKEDLLQVFRLVNNYLEPNGLFLFDMNTEYKFKTIFAQNVFAETTENAAYIWENFYDEQEKINEFYMNFFIKQSNGAYKRNEEFHYERAYSLKEIEALLTESGLEFVCAYDAYTFEKPKTTSERIFVVAKERLKKKICISNK